ncbi:shikimate dehydrogenase [Pseudodesulfovibrio piezophilus]|uniref:Shikimate dehydrogenase (NADP(+)) n=1 Tax=Pseudodesulfovibrio piezophilus (strain DSM 21447 / JCM 15486 / C1TLV30) TaxID=1322246 RepID=M1WR97_PSEP2|nr:shikimate dehydrogenase [Pseudodesulfovibrio piezophilus]CCH49399.1 Shikimate dehydrogenase [Pseudodesulfovibrio piezophilus C1TLV30]
MSGLYGIIGWPLGHTMSPTLHNWGFRQSGADAAYAAYPLEPDQIPDFMRRVRDEPFLGLSVTIPHKRTVMEFLDHMTDRAVRVGAVNTLYWDEGKLCGENTDVLGLIAPLRHMQPLPASAMILGAGGAARAAVVGFKELGIADIAIANRTGEKAEALAEEFSIRAVAWESRMEEEPALICNTTPLGMSGTMETFSPWDAKRFPAGCTVYDIVYNPLETRLLREAAAVGCGTVSGLEMFLHQGLAQFRLWTGKDMDEAGARALLLCALGQAPA